MNYKFDFQNTPTTTVKDLTKRLHDEFNGDMKKLAYGLRREWVDRFSDAVKELKSVSVATPKLPRLDVCLDANDEMQVHCDQSCTAFNLDSAGAMESLVEQVCSDLKHEARLAKGFDAYEQAFHELDKDIWQLGGNIKYNRPYFQVTIPNENSLGCSTYELTGSKFNLMMLMREIRVLKDKLESMECNLKLGKKLGAELNDIFK